MVAIPNIHLVSTRGVKVYTIFYKNDEYSYVQKNEPRISLGYVFHLIKLIAFYLSQFLDLFLKYSFIEYCIIFPWRKQIK